MNRFFEFLECCVSMALMVIITPAGWIGMVILGTVIWISKQ